LTRRWLDLRDHLDERSRRLWLAAEARSLGYGGIGSVAAVTKAAKDTISDKIKELAGQAPPRGRVRRAGAGRKRRAGGSRVAGGAGRAGGAGDPR
jgi:hypothetical protein